MGGAKRSTIARRPHESPHAPPLLPTRFDAKQAKAPYTWYEGVGGTGSPEYMLMIAREGWAGFDAGRANLEGVLQTVDDATVRQQLLDGYAAAVEDVTSEIWRYRTEMSLIPGR